MLIDGHRRCIWSAEFDYWLQSSTSERLEVLEKMKAEGFNAVMIYFDWAYHSSSPEVYDFSEIRNINLLLDDAAMVDST